MHILLLTTLFILFIQSNGFFFGLGGGGGGGCSNCPCGTSSPSCSMFCPQSNSLNCQSSGYSTGYAQNQQQTFSNQGNQGNYGNFGSGPSYSNFANSYQQPPPPPPQYQQQLNYPPRLPPYSPPGQFTNTYVSPPYRTPIPEVRQQLSLGTQAPQYNQYQSIPQNSDPSSSHYQPIQPSPVAPSPAPTQVQSVTEEHDHIQSILDQYQKSVVPAIRNHVPTQHTGAPAPIPSSSQYQPHSTQDTVVEKTVVIEKMEPMTHSSTKTDTTLSKPVSEQESAQLSLEPPSVKKYTTSDTAEKISSETPKKSEQLTPEEIGRSIEDTYDEKSMTDEKLQISPLGEQEEETFTRKESHGPIRTFEITMAPHYDDTKEYTEYFSSPAATANSNYVEETTRSYGVTFQYIQETTTTKDPVTIEYEIPVSKSYGRTPVPAKPVPPSKPIVNEEILSTTTTSYQQITPAGYEFKNENPGTPEVREPQNSSLDTEVGLPPNPPDYTTESEGNPYGKFRDEQNSNPGDSKKKDTGISANNNDSNIPTNKRNIPDPPLDKCNNARLKEIMNERMRSSASVSKQMIYALASTEFPGFSLNVICSRHSFSYIVVTSPIFCEHKKLNLTCFAFFQP